MPGESCGFSDKLKDYVCPYTDDSVYCTEPCQQEIGRRLVAIAKGRNPTQADFEQALDFLLKPLLNIDEEWLHAKLSDLR